ncbi:MAG: hypothetical protein ABIB46_04310 [bacterium]
MKKFLFLVFLIFFIFCTFKFFSCVSKKVKIYNETLLKSKQKAIEIKNKVKDRSEKVKQRIEEIFKTQEIKDIEKID